MNLRTFALVERRCTKCHDHFLNVFLPTLAMVQCTSSDAYTFKNIQAHRKWVGVPPLVIEVRMRLKATAQTIGLIPNKARKRRIGSMLWRPSVRCIICDASWVKVLQETTSLIATIRNTYSPLCQSSGQHCTKSTTNSSTTTDMCSSTL